MEESTLNPFDVGGTFTLQKNCLVQQFAKNRQEDDHLVANVRKGVDQEDGWMLHKFAQRKCKGVRLLVHHFSKIVKEDGSLVLRFAKTICFNVYIDQQGSLKVLKSSFYHTRVRSLAMLVSD